MKGSPYGLLVALLVQLPTAFAADVRFTIDNILSTDGALLIALHPSQDEWPNAPRSAKLVRLVPNKAGVAGVFSDVPEGVYAVTVIHDVNGNGKLDSNFIGMPKEPVGVSGNKFPAMSAPRYEDAKFTVSDKDVALTIKMRQP